MLSPAVELNPAPIVITDLRGSIQYVNPQFTEVTGYALDDVIGANARILRSAHTSKETIEELWNTVQSGSVWRGLFCNTKKCGDLLWQTAFISQQFNVNGQPTGFVAVYEDLTLKVKDALNRNTLRDTCENQP